MLLKDAGEEAVGLGSFVENVLEAARNYNVVDYTLFKFCLLAIGVLLGVYFVAFWEQYLALVWLVAILTYIFIIYKTFFVYYKR